MAELHLDSFCATALLLGVPIDEVKAEISPAQPPTWLSKYHTASGSHTRAAQLAPRLLAVRMAVERGRVRWG